MITVKSAQRFFSAFFTAFVFVGLFGATASAEEQNPYKLVTEVATTTFDRLKRERADIESDPELLRTIMKEELLPYVDYRFSALKVLGKHYKTVPREKIPEFIQVFKDYLITTYALAMAQYDDQTVDFEPGRDDYTKQKVVTVRGLVKEEGRPDIKIAFKVRKNRKTNEWKAYDMVAEGISLLSSKQSELEAIIRQDGIDTVIDLLKAKNDQPISIEKRI